MKHLSVVVKAFCSLGTEDASLISNVFFVSVSLMYAHCVVRQIHTSKVDINNCSAVRVNDLFITPGTAVWCTNYVNCNIGFIF